MAVEIPFAPGSATRCKAATAKALEVVEQDVEAVACIEVLLFLYLASKSVFGGQVFRLSISGPL